MGEMRDSDWSRRNLLRSDWLGPKVAMYTTHRRVCLLLPENKKLRIILYPRYTNYQRNARGWLN